MNVTGRVLRPACVFGVCFAADESFVEVGETKQLLSLGVCCELLGCGSDANTLSVLSGCLLLDVER